MRRRRPRWRLALGGLAVTLLLLVLAAWLALRASLPQLDGEWRVPGFAATTEITRDALGVPTIRGQDRLDVARATGIAHAQDRLFQMDLTRRAAAGELAALLGPGLVDTDRRLRVHQFRKRARAVLEALAGEERALVEAYAGGVNEGIASLGLRPFEYLLLGRQPAPWRAEDCLLVAYAMWIDLQGTEAREELQRERLATVLPGPLYRLLTAPDPAFEATLDGSRSPLSPLPVASEVDLRKLDPALFEPASVVAGLGPGLADEDAPALALGSNNWALGGARTASGRALVANDMHLGLRVPNVWYRLRLQLADGSLDVTGVSLPGTPLVIAGSNGHVAWGYTNSYGDFQDLVRVEPVAGREGYYLTPEGPEAITVQVERIEVAGGQAEELRVRKTRWGPIVGDDGNGTELALAWTAHRAEAVNLGLLAMEGARDVAQAAAIAAASGMPAQNVMLGDASGRIGWVISGRLPQRSGYDPGRPASWATAATGWQGWLDPASAPRLLDPADGLAWSANARVVGGDWLTAIGDGGYAASARARQIRDRLAPMAAATPAEMLALQLDDQATYVALWQPLLKDALQALDHPDAARALALVEGWSGRARPEDAGYRLLRQFEREATRRAWRMLTAEARSRWPDFRWQAPARFTETAWRLLHEQPPHLLDPRFAGWEAWLADVAREVLEKLPENCPRLDLCSWGRVNSLRMRHPLSQALPLVGDWLDMPADPLPGDWSTPRVQSQTFGASQRFAVSPGLEAEGYFHMPGGQSGHPLSPFYRAGHQAWVRGEPTPFLPGPAAHSLTLLPSR